MSRLTRTIRRWRGVEPPSGSVCDYTPARSRQFSDFLALIAPVAVDGPAKARFGRERDGGYVMLDDLHGIGTVFSAGVGEDVSFDLAIAEQEIRVVMLDHTVPGPPAAHPRFEFRPVKLASDGKGAGAISLAELLAEADGDCICKIDIEGDEWGLLARTPPERLARARQILVEFHELHKFFESAWRQEAFAALRVLGAGHRCIHIHGNNFKRHVIIGGIPFPDTFEATFAAREAYRFIEGRRESFPTPLDRPNSPGLADLHIGTMEY